ncbi:MAG TPA: metal-dependent hydrolase [Thermomicrobiales bacterium]|jgi:L-ascorbate metabolism protein UlaG (beta-lactamase superfamily)|nr:metal-dependent hydrolase [Thermomicrobiales bacterium]
MKITFIGHSAFALEADGKQVLVDPFITGNPVANVSPGDFSPQTIILTHAHNDHVGDTVDIAKRSGAKVIATAELANWVGSQGVEGATGANHGGTVRFSGGSTKFVPAWHTSSYSTKDGVVAPGVPAGHIVRFGGKTLYFAGDTCLFGDMALIGEAGIDVAIIPIGDHFTMGPDDALRAVQLISPAMVIPCHYNTFPPIQQDGMAFKKRVETDTTARCLLLNPGESSEI